MILFTDTAADVQPLGVTAPQGFRAAGVRAGLKSAGRDVALVVNDGPQPTSAMVLTSNRVYAAPVRWMKQIAGGTQTAAVINSGGANAATGQPGFEDTVTTARHTAAMLGREPEEVAVCSTGLIGERLPMSKLLAGIADAGAHLSTDAGADAAEAICTTDTVSKQAGIAGPYTIGGMAKGAGMLAPGMATMICVITTDAVLTNAQAQEALEAAVAASFNRIDSDGAMSTNDTVLLLASGASGVVPEDFTGQLTAVAQSLARQLIADAEGASHDVLIRVVGASSQEAGLAVARAVSRSNLLKAAIFGNDPNWGRVIAQVGTVPADVAPYDADALDVYFNGVQVCLAGGVGEDRTLVDLASNREVAIEIDLHAGEEVVELWTNDLTHDYVHENSAYST
ncbi:bifunctional glutamate N-acetyltransferase/amino-acid acetyltransferase ArgJ [Trueperella bernardiae]|uniref:Arginine biosynthesis bifunctional protein ArgJ n=1 Tax=Trueperella bernardiae TaxID=59561 RepID=A0AAW6ZGS1_9ACTO|nr:bifunctional glutamate N-acetyltransferase/amino-acid acetyltransferase ArgJ [Trueperella bernardiae]MDK8602470.1 bifunctional glutamate N-acetyltransferase/amino-acid acetyltransferase ArgJ [Trueperella bernardiae]OCW60157.1 N-acetylglutamate synthase [Trueperella bernardiae]WIM07120.1 bifunctional glutamate N-acetyltransferase/amino-acid acetyltransferase ArgJ [Trueperella bernardiae]